MGDVPVKPDGNGVPAVYAAGVVPFRLRAAYAVPLGWPPDVSPNQLIEADHLNRIRTSVYAWPGDVDGLNHTLANVHLTNVTGVMVDPTTVAGDLIVRDAGTVPVRFPVGAQGQVLTVDTAVASKLKWVTPVPAVASVFGRTGVVVAAVNDYTAAQVTNAVSTLGSYADPVWITSLAWAKVAGAPATFPPSAHTHDAADIATGRLNTARLGSGIADANVYLRGDGVWAAAAGGGGAAGVASFKGRTGAVVPQTGDYTAAQVSGAVVDPTIAVGDLLVRGTSAVGRLPLGANGQILTADNAVAGGVRWGTAPGGPGLPGGLTDGDIAQWKSGAWQIVPVGTTGQVLMVDTAGNGLRWGSGGAGSQTPWLTDVDGGNHALNNVSSIVSNGSIKSGSGGFIFPDGSTQVSAAGQSPWNVDIDANGHTLANVGRAPLAAVASVGAAINLKVTDTNAVMLDIATRRTALGSGHTFIEHRIQRGVDGTPQGYIAFRSGGQAVTLGNGVQDMMTVADTGNVGIGVATPQYKLDVGGDLNFTGAIRKSGVVWNPQTPWLTDIDANNKQLLNASTIYANAVHVFLSNNLIYSGGWKLINAGPGMYVFNTGSAFSFQGTVSGAAGSAAGIVDMLTLDPAVAGVRIGAGVSEGKLTVDNGDIMIRSGNALQMRRADNGWNMTLRQTNIQLDILSGGGGGAIASFAHGGAVSMPGNVTIGNTLYATGPLTANYDAAAVRLGATAGASGWTGAPRLSFFWGSVATQLAMDSAGVLTCLTWNTDNYSSIRCNTLYANAAAYGGNVQAATYNGYTISAGVTPGTNKLLATDGNGWFFTGYLNTNIGLEGIVPTEFYVTNGSDQFIRKTSAQNAANAIYAQTCTGNINILHSGTTGVNVGTAINSGQYGSLYWVDTDASINLYHSAIGHVLKIRLQQPGGVAEYYLPNVRGDAGPANSGRLYRVGNTLMIS